MFPAIFTLAIEGLGRHTEQGSGILCAAIVGGAVIPWLQGVFADSAGLHISFVLPAVCYIYIAWYGLKGHATDAKPGPGGRRAADHAHFRVVQADGAKEYDCCHDRFVWSRARGSAIQLAATRSPPCWRWRGSPPTTCRRPPPGRWCCRSRFVVLLLALRKWAFAAAVFCSVRGC